MHKSELMFFRPLRWKALLLFFILSPFAEAGIVGNLFNSGCEQALNVLGYPAGRVLEWGLTRASKEWQLSKATESKISELFKNEVEADRAIPKLVEILTEARASKLKSTKAQKLLNIYRNKISIPEATFEQENFLTPSFNALLFQIYSPTGTISTGTQAFIDFHEFQHAEHGVRMGAFPYFFWFAAFGHGPLITPLPVFLGASTYVIEEAYAIGAQWELLKHIPLNMRMKWADQLKKELEDNSPQLGLTIEVTPAHRRAFVARVLLEVVIESLRHAHYTKMDFIERMLEFHGYEISQVVHRNLNGYLMNPAIRLAISTWWISTHIVLPGFIAWKLLH